MNCISERIKTTEKILSFVLRCKLALIQINMERSVEFNFLKPLQSKSIKAALENDVLAILQTGYGKSLIFEMVAKIIGSNIIIISPLNAIIEEQVQKFGDKSLHITPDAIKNINSDKDEISQKVKDGKIVYIFGHPEQLLRKEICDVFRRDSWKNISHIIVDEAHCVVTWGYDFRPDFQKLSKLRAIFPCSKVLALTATATNTMQKEIIKVLAMKTVVTIQCNVDRPNLKIIVKKRLPSSGSKSSSEESFHDVLQPYVKKLCENPRLFQKTIIYSKLKHCGAGYDMVYIQAKLSKSFNDIMDSVSQFHAPCKEQIKRHIVKDMSDVDGDLKLLFATEAYGMGADASDVRRIIHIGPPTSLETYIQEIGRAGRDGRSSQAILYFNMSDIAQNTNIKSEIREFCLLDTCRRNFLCEHFSSELVKELQLHDCCDNCAKKCDCDSCFGEIIEACTIESDAFNSNSKTTGKANSKKLGDVYCELLRSYFTAENNLIHTPNNPEVTSGLNDSLIYAICDSFEIITCENDLKVLFPYLQLHYIHNIWNILAIAPR